MTFVSWEFLSFFLGAALLYFILPQRWRWVWLLIASYGFYAICDYRYLLFIGVTTLSTYAAGRWLDRENRGLRELLAAHPAWERSEKKAAKATAQQRKKGGLLAALLLNFGLLALLKYYNFFAFNADWLLSSLGAGFVLPAFDFLLPLGISFYTFQAAGYVIDVYRGKYAADRNLARYALFLSWFPQLLQGPIGRYDQLAQQLYQPHNFDFRRCRFALQLLGWGCFKKIVLADRLAPLVTALFSNYAGRDGALLFFAAAAYGVQIYADFSGGIDMARGVSQFFGVELAENFRRPYFSHSISEFWRRWHITLGSWMKDYLFYPLALSRPLNRLGRRLSRHNAQLGKLLPTCLVSLMVFMVVGVWHGAEWRYLVYGLWNGGLIALSTLLAPAAARFNQALHIDPQGRPHRLFQLLRTFVLVTLGRFFVRSASLTQAFTMFKRCFTDFHLTALGNGALLELGVSGKSLAVIGGSLLVLLLVGVLQERGWKLRERLDQEGIALQFLIELAAIAVVLVFGLYGPAYDAADFIYMQF